ncbi:hypothetical protein EJ03DRAFT_354611 [Teratosphaeria nubilosa]|uniref:CUE domain-containing protein n=1 Tax=Teratosphaeria nubilosa TaxID=161662 RepID=A0A6G1KZY4_9PEZI|nr:hypothetical protein EJ03DRAFT_354611 [Teratosphaeria nubilosa]
MDPRNKLAILKATFPDWRDDDLLSALDDFDGDVKSAVRNITQGRVPVPANAVRLNDKARSKDNDAPGDDDLSSVELPHQGLEAPSKQDPVYSNLAHKMRALRFRDVGEKAIKDRAYSDFVHKQQLQALLSGKKYFDDLEDIEVKVAQLCKVDAIFSQCTVRDGELIGTLVTVSIFEKNSWVECIDLLDGICSALMLFQDTGMRANVVDIFVDDPARSQVVDTKRLALTEVYTLQRELAKIDPRKTGGPTGSRDKIIPLVDSTLVYLLDLKRLRDLGDISFKYFR